MSRIRPFAAADLFSFNPVNLDHFTETYSTSYYLSYLAVWPDLCYIATKPHLEEGGAADGGVGEMGREAPMGYLIGKAEGRERGRGWSGSERERELQRHGHVSAITVSPSSRRLGLASQLMSMLERASQEAYEAYFVDLFVRPSNELAVGLYEGLEYTVYRKVREYYQGGGPGGGDEDGIDMRKALPRDAKKETIRESSKGMRVIVDTHATIFDPVYRT